MAHMGMYFNTQCVIAQGSVRTVVDGTGAVRQRFDYYPYGTVSRSWFHTVHRKKVGEKAFRQLTGSEKEKWADDYSTNHWSYSKTSQYRKNKIANHK